GLELLDRGEPLVLVHGVARDEEGEHVADAGVGGHLVEPADLEPALRLGGDVVAEVREQVAAGDGVACGPGVADAVVGRRAEPVHDHMLRVHPAEHGGDHRVLRRLFLRIDRPVLEQPRDHRGEHLDVRDLLGPDVEDHVAVLGGPAAVPALEQVAHHHADLAPLAAEHLLELPRVHGVRALGLRVVLEPFVMEEHGYTSGGRGVGAGSRWSRGRARGCNARAPEAGGRARWRARPRAAPRRRRSRPRSRVKRRPWGSPARRLALVAHRAVGRDEGPAVGVLVQLELQHAGGAVDPALAVGLDAVERAQVRAAGADHELADAVGVGVAVGVLRREALVVVVVAGEREVDARLVSHPPELAQVAVAAVRPGAEAGMVPVRDGAGRGVRGEVGREPRELLGAGLDVDLAVQRDDVPGAEVVAVVSLARLAGVLAEVLEVRRRARRAVVVVAGDRPRALAVPSPGRVVALRELLRRAARVRVVAEREDGAGDRVEQRGGRLVAVAAAPRDVARADEHGRRVADGRLITVAGVGFGCGGGFVAGGEQDECRGGGSGRGTGGTTPWILRHISLAYFRLLRFERTGALHGVVRRGSRTGSGAQRPVEHRQGVLERGDELGRELLAALVADLLCSVRGRAGGAVG